LLASRFSLLASRFSLLASRFSLLASRFSPHHSTDPPLAMTIATTADVRLGLAPGTLYAFCEELTQASSAIIRKYYRQPYEVISKADASPVTIADREAELALRALIQERFPDHGILGEEHGLHQPDARLRWVLDPIDGTKNFISHSYLFGTLIALCENGRPLLGVIHHPVTGDLMIGDGSTTWLNGSPVRVRPCARIEDAVALSSAVWTHSDVVDSARMEALARRTLRFNTWGDCHGYFLVACGGADLMLDPQMSVWDLMALIPIIEGAGGRITDWQGNPAAAGSSAIATAGTIHDEVVRSVND
ncbi:MAG: inositol monophosphatase family protein, partial [Caldilineaceae bacterium]